MERATRRDVSPVPSTPRIAPTIRDFRPPDRPRGGGPRLVAGYELLEEIGRGGMGVVYKARQVQLDRLVALKMIGSASASREDLVRFRTEAEAVARLQHPHIVQIHEIGEHEGQPFFSLEYLDGGSLDRLLTGKPLAHAAAAALVEKLAGAVHYAHERGIIHRDLKPANILLAEGLNHRDTETQRRQQESAAEKKEPSSPSSSLLGASVSLWFNSSSLTPKIADFGLARLDSKSRQTQAGAIVGTPSYMAPEQAHGNTDVGPAADVHALGAILYECLTGRPPFNAESVVATLQQVRQHDPVPPRRLTPGVPRDLETICLKCLQKEPRQRYASAADLADDLNRFLAGKPVLARPVSWLGRAVKWAKRRPSTAALLATTGLLLCVLMLVVLRQADEDRRRLVLAHDCREEITRARPQLESNDFNTVMKAVQALDQIVGRIGDRDIHADKELARLHAEASDLAAHGWRRWSRLTRAGEAQKKARDFLRLYSEAFFHLHKDIVPGADAASPATSAALARQALDGFPNLDCLDEPLRHKVALARQELYFLLAEATARLSGEKHLRQALAILDQGAASGAGLQAVHRRRARYLELLGDSAGAAQEQRKAASMRVAGPLDWFLLGLERWQASLLPQALECFDRARNQQPDLFWAQFFVALTQQRLNNRVEARATLDECIRQRQDFVWLYLLRGHLHERAGRYADAEEDFARAEQLQPDTAARYVIHVNRGMLALAEKNMERAAAELQRAALLLPNRYHAFANLAEVYWKRGQHERAVAALDHAVRLQPDLAALYRTRAARQRQRGKLEAALRDLDHAIRLEPAVGNALGGVPSELAGDHRERARILYKQARYPEALAACGQALRLAPEDRAGLRLHAEVLLELGRYAESVGAFNRFLEKGKADVEVYRRRARARAGAGDVAGVVDDYTLAMSLPRTIDTPVAALLSGRGWAYLVTGSPRAALRDFEAALKVEPNSAEALAGRGSARLDLGDVKGGVADAEAALRRRPLSQRMLYNVARLLARAGASGIDKRIAAGYRSRALAVLRDTLRHVPVAQRRRFWHEKVRRDSAFRSLLTLADFIEMEKELTEERPAASAL
jgi:serine/threonine protein kinase/tetratricopeptide (TPR) repeat protein